MKNSGKKRNLSASEIQMARLIFGEQIDYDIVQIANRRILPMFQPKSGGMCTANTINITGTAYCDEYTQKLSSFFIHEMTHIWQFQKSPAYFGKKYMAELRKHHFNYAANAYKYELVEGKDFHDYGLEQQACIVQDYFALTHNSGVGVSRSCQNQNLKGEEKRLALKKVLEPHFPLASAKPAAPKKGPKPF